MTLLGDKDPDEGKDNPEWMKTLPEDLGKARTLAKFKPADGEELVPMPLSVAKSYVELEKKMGDPDSLIRIPGDNATPEERDAFFNKIGRPGKLEEYEIAGKEEPENAKKINDRFRKVAFEHGVSKTAFKALSGELDAIASEMASKDGILAVTDAETQLKSEWKNDYPVNLKKAEVAARALGGEEFLNLVNKSGLGANPLFLKGLVKAASFLPEESLKGIQGVRSGAPAVTRAKLEQMMLDPRYWDQTRRDPAYVKMVEDGFKAIAPGQVKLAATDRNEI